MPHSSIAETNGNLIFRNLQTVFLSGDITLHPAISVETFCCTASLPTFVFICISEDIFDKSEMDF